MQFRCCLATCWEFLQPQTMNKQQLCDRQHDTISRLLFDCVSFFVYIFLWRSSAFQQRRLYARPFISIDARFFGACGWRFSGEVGDELWASRRKQTLFGFFFGSRLIPGESFLCGLDWTVLLRFL